jgi:hypothetical protein
MSVQDLKNTIEATTGRPVPTNIQETSKAVINFPDPNMNRMKEWIPFEKLFALYQQWLDSDDIKTSPPCHRLVLLCERETSGRAIFLGIDSVDDTKLFSSFLSTKDKQDLYKTNRATTISLLINDEIDTDLCGFLQLAFRV